MPRVLIAGRIHPDGLALLDAEPGLEYQIVADPAADLTPDQVADADALLIRYGIVSEELAARMGKLRVVSRHGVGCDNLPVDYLASRGVPVTIVGPVNAVSVAEQVMAMLMAMLRRIGPYDAAVRSGDWGIRESLAVGELAGRTLLLLGFGRIGREVVPRALAFEMNVNVFDPFVSADDIRAAGCNAVTDWRAVLPDTDVLSLHLPLTDVTRGLIGVAELARIKPTAIMINAARGGLVDEQALFSALSGRMARGGAALDCFEAEPVRPDLPLLTLPNVLVSPHSSALSAETARRMGRVAAQNVIDGLARRLDPALVFNRRQLVEAGYAL